MKAYAWIFVLSLALSAVLCRLTIPILKRLKAGQSILCYVKAHKGKEGTPTMGGVSFILSSVIISLLFCGRSDFRNTLVLCSVGVAFGIVGLLDDIVKIKGRRNEGLSPIQKIVFQLVVAAIVSVYMLISGRTQIYVPFTAVTIDIKFYIIPLYIFVFVATTNCVNLTDGLDGLAAGVSCVYLFALAALVIAQRGFVCAAPEVTLSVALVGALIGFLAFNTHRASVFMGDTGSLALGGFISAVSIFGGNVLFIPLLGVTFVCSGLSVIAQVLYFKRTHRRIFLMAPMHHHFQMKGASEEKIVFFYKLVTLIVGIACVTFYI